VGWKGCEAKEEQDPEDEEFIKIFGLFTVSRLAPELTQRPIQ
jgi:hypothetical protein